MIFVGVNAHFPGSYELKPCVWILHSKINSKGSHYDVSHWFVTYSFLFFLKP